MRRGWRLRSRSSIAFASGAALGARDLYGLPQTKQTKTGKRWETIISLLETTYLETWSVVALTQVNLLSSTYTAILVYQCTSALQFYP